MKFFIGNWKMFGILSSKKIIEKINKFKTKDRSNNYKIIITPPYTLIESFAKKFKNSNVAIGAQNCFFKEKFSSNTGAISPFMIKKSGASYVIVGHSDNRAEGDNDEKLKLKLNFCLKLNLRVIFCIGENKKEKKNKKTLSVLKRQLTKVLEKKFNKNNIKNKLNLLIENEKCLKLQLKNFNNLENVLINKNIKPSVYALKIIKNILNFD